MATSSGEQLAAYGHEFRDATLAARYSREAAMTAAHEQKHTFTEVTEYDAHDKRTESAEFRKNKRQMVRQLDLPCWICGSRDAREVHHIHEWALWPKLDPEKVLDTLHVFDPYGYTHHLGDQPIASPDDIRNLLVLCGSHTIDGVEIPGGHHRGVNIGVHDITFAIWIAQRSVKDGETITHAINKALEIDHKLAGTRQIGTK
jgi:hypothetical protein